jgi:hypothetical protein
VKRTQEDERFTFRGAGNELPELARIGGPFVKNRASSLPLLQRGHQAKDF